MQIEGDKLKVITSEGELKSRIEGLRKLVSATNRVLIGTMKKLNEEGKPRRRKLKKLKGGSEKN